MFNENLLTIVKQAEESKVTVDVFLLVVVFLVLWWGFRRRPVVFSILFATFAIIYSLNEVMATQSLEMTKIDGVISEIRVRNNSSSPFKLNQKNKMILAGCAAFSGVIQVANMIDGTHQYNLTRSVSTNTVMNLFENVTYRSHITSDPPEKMIFLCQHGCEMMDVLSFFAFIPRGYKLTVLNDFTGGGNIGNATASIFHKLFAKNLYGAHVFNRSDKTKLKKQISDFVDLMQTPGPRVFCIWPSGKLWESKFKNGVECFKPGTFYMSGYTGVPVCIISQRLSTDRKKLVIEQSDIIYPPKISVENNSYIQFYENETHKSSIEEYRLRVENLYRDIDDRLVAELTKE